MGAQNAAFRDRDRIGMRLTCPIARTHDCEDPGWFQSLRRPACFADSCPARRHLRHGSESTVARGGA